MSVEFHGRDLVVHFREDPSNQAIRQYKIEYVCASKTVTHYVKVDDAQGTDGDGNRLYKDQLSYGENEAAGLSRQPQVVLYAQNADLKWSAGLTISAENSYPVFSADPSITPTLDGVQVSVRLPADGDFEGIVAWVGSSSDFTLDDAHERYRGKASTFDVQLPDDETYYLRIAPYDLFGLNPQMAITAIPIQRGDLSAAVSETTSVQDIKNDIQSLFDEYGDTASAAQSASAAEQSAQTAATAATTANTARDQATQAVTDAQTILDGADTAKSGAEAAQSAAETARDDAQTAASNADGSAQAAAGSASTAGTKATNAGNSATAAQASATTASTKAGEASDSADAAATSASSASSSATDAAQSASTATTAKNTAVTKAGEASTSASNAATSASDALGSKNAAATSATNAAQSATTAGQKATAAATSASTAASEASDAAQSASSAQTSANTATTKAGNASTSASQAASSASDALGYRNQASTYASNAAGSATLAGQKADAASTSASTASTKANEASQSADAAQASSVTASSNAQTRGATPNADFNNGLDSWFDSTSDTPVSSYSIWSHLPTFQGRAGVMKLSASTSRYVHGELTPIDTSRKYRVKIGVYADGPSNRCYAGLIAYDANKNALNSNPGSYCYAVWGGSTILPDDQWVDAQSNPITGEGTGTWTIFPAGTKYAAPMAILNYQSGSYGSSHVDYLYIEDVTESVDAEQSASAAATSASQASSYKDQAASSASSASTSATNANTYKGQAQTYASQASSSKDSAASSASSASTSSGTAATYRDQAKDYRDDALSYRNSASSYASTASSQASLATSQAAAASTSASIAASVSVGALNPNPIFAEWSGSASSRPDVWSAWGGSGYTRVSGLNGPYAMQQSVAAGANNGLTVSGTAGYGISSMTPGYYVMEADVTLDSGSLAGGGMLFDLFGSSYSRQTLDFAVEIGNGVVGNTYRVRKLVHATYSSGTAGRIYLMTGWTGFSASVTAKTLTWHRCSIRPASDAEIKTGEIDSLAASVTTQQGAIADLQGKTGAYWVTTANAGSSNAIISARADGTSSNVSLAAQTIKLISYNGSGGYKDALVIENGNVVLAGTLRANAVQSSHIATNAVTADKINVSSLSALSATIGVLRTRTSGGRTEIRDDVTYVYDDSNVLRVKLGKLS